MEHIAALLLIVGCSSDLKQCVELPAPIPVYETLEECGSDLTPALSAARGEKPFVKATCVFVDPAMAEEDAELTWDVRPDGRLVASINAMSPDMMLTSSINAAETSATR